MFAMLLMLVACLAAWAHVVRMLDEARYRLEGALTGDLSQAGGWMPSAAPAERRAASRRLVRA
jgi:hypothetical protein